MKMNNYNRQASSCLEFDEHDFKIGDLVSSNVEIDAFFIKQNDIGIILFFCDKTNILHVYFPSAKKPEYFYSKDIRDVNNSFLNCENVFKLQPKKIKRVS